MDMKRIYIYTTLCFLLSYVGAEAQQAEQGLSERAMGTPTVARSDDKQMTKRTLAECIQLAVKANPSLLQNELDVKRAEVNLAQAKANRLPNMNANMNHVFSFGRFFDESTKQYVNSNSEFGSYGIDANIPLFRGLGLLYDIRMKADAKSASKLEFDSQINALRLDVITCFIQVLTAKDVLKQSEMQTEVTKEQVNRAEAMHKEGAISPGDYFDLKGQLANDMNTIQNNRQLLYAYRVKLANFLNIDEQQLGDLQPPEYVEDGRRLSSEQLFQLATEALPNIPALDWRIKAAEKNIKVAKAAYWPSLSLGAGMNSNFSNTKTDKFWDQVNNNLGKSISLGLSIPIFNRFQVLNQVKLAKLDLESAKFRKEMELNNLRAETSKAVFNLENANNMIVQLRSQNENYAESFRIAKVVFELGNSNSVIFLTAKNKFDNSQIQLVVKQYEWLLQKYINDYYASSLNL